MEVIAHMTIGKEVADQLLLSMSLLEKIRLQAAPNPDRFSLVLRFKNSVMVFGRDLLLQ
jgi:hypothetical protein